MEGVWSGENGVETTCIMTPMPNHLYTHLSLFYYSSFDEWGWCGNGEVEMMRAIRERKINGLYRNADK